jgi:predicted Rossmann-fold nucleotide-binding protein
MFEVLTLTQTNKVRKRPIVLVGREFWSKLIDWDWLVETGMIAADDLKLFHLVETAEEAWAVLETELGLDGQDTGTGEFADDV